MLLFSFYKFFTTFRTRYVLASCNAFSSVLMMYSKLVGSVWKRTCFFRLCKLSICCEVSVFLSLDSIAASGVLFSFTASESRWNFNVIRGTDWLRRLRDATRASRRHSNSRNRYSTRLIWSRMFCTKCFLLVTNCHRIEICSGLNPHWEIKPKSSSETFKTKINRVLRKKSGSIKKFLLH